MDRIWESGASASPPAAPSSPSSGYPTAGNPATGTPATVPGAHWYNMVTEELRTLVESGGLTPDHLSLNQIAKAVQAGGYRKSNAAGTADAITGSFTPSIAALTEGMTLYVRAASANATATPTFTPASGTIAAKTIVKGAGAALAAGDIAGAGHWLALQYDATLDKWVLQNPALSSGSLIGVQIFSVAGANTYTPTPGMKSVVVEVQGAGGGGGGAASTTAGQVAVAAGGGGGSYGKGRYTAAQVGASLTVTVGAGGGGGAAGNNPGVAGGTSSFGALLSASGGNSGVGSDAVTPPVVRIGGNISAVAVGGNILNATGSVGGSGIGVVNIVGGNGGGSAILGGGGGAAYSPGNQIGQSGRPGAGGGGGCSLGVGSAYAGGAGGAGLVIVWEYA